ncbi:MAG TPA: FHA domain-containing protein [Acidimicrobiales bacterium]|nr:FHA domain-containing protein [Acidimicrobiales bacterium]
MAVVTCPHCGHQNPLGSNFCSSCGADLDLPSEHGTTASVLVPIDTPAEEIEIELDELPRGVGMLVVTRGPNSGSRYALDEPVVSAGRHPDSTIFLDDITVSRRHAEIRQVAGGYQVRDVGSLNGTYLNRERVEESSLRDGDELQIGTFKLLFLAGRS